MDVVLCETTAMKTENSVSELLKLFLKSLTVQNLILNARSIMHVITTVKSMSDTNITLAAHSKFKYE